MDLDEKGKEFKFNHCWLPSEIQEIINIIKKEKIIGGKNKKIISYAEKIEKDWRADPADGLRPLRKFR